MTIKIGLCGEARSGKDTVGAYLIEHHGFKRFSFGDGIRSICKTLYPDQMAENKPRALLQGVGQSLRRFDENVWVNLAFQDIGKHEGNVVVTDLRQPNEYERLKSEGFVIIRVNASSTVRIERMIEIGDEFKPEDLAHETERHIDSFDVDYELYNSGRIIDLYQQIDVIMRDIARK